MTKLNKAHLELLQELAHAPLTKAAYQRDGCHGNWLVASGLVVRVGGVYHITQEGRLELAERTSVKTTQIVLKKAKMPAKPIELKFRMPKGKVVPRSIKEKTLKGLVDAAVAYGTVPRERSLNDLLQDLKRAAQTVADEVNR